MRWKRYMKYSNGTYKNAGQDLIFQTEMPQDEIIRKLEKHEINDTLDYDFFEQNHEYFLRVKGIKRFPCSGILSAVFRVEFLENKKRLQRNLKKFDGIYVETNTMKVNMEKLCFSNIYILPNCKELKILKENELVYAASKPFKLCTFSRVMKEKGIEDAVNAVEEINKKYGETVFTLDIYGQIDSMQTEWFESLQSRFSKDISYKGLVPFDKSTGVLKNYYALLFPTRFYTEGIPGTIIDAYASGVPVISAKWESFNDLVNEKIVGYGYTFGNYNELIKCLYIISKNVNEFNLMKKNCLVHAGKYSARYIMNKFIDLYLD